MNSGTAKVMASVNRLQELRLLGAPHNEQLDAVLDLYQSIAENHLDMAMRMELLMEQASKEFVALRKSVGST